MEGFQEAACSPSIFVQLLGWHGPSLPLAPHIPAIAPLSQERAPMELGDHTRSDLPWSAATAMAIPRQGAGGPRQGTQDAGQAFALALCHLLPHDEALASLPAVISEGCRAGPRQHPSEIPT